MDICLETAAANKRPCKSVWQALSAVFLAEKNGGINGSRIPEAFYHAFLLRKMYLCYFNRFQTGLHEHSLLMSFLKAAMGRRVACVSCPESKWLGEMAQDSHAQGQ